MIRSRAGTRTMPTRSSLAARCGATLLLVMFAAACSSGAATSPAGAQGPTLAAGTSAAPAGQGQSQQAGSSAAAAGSVPPPVSGAKLTAVPKTCPSADDVTLALGVSVPHLYPNGEANSLNCEYYVDGSKTSPTVNITFGLLGSGDTAATLEAAMKAKSTDVQPVSGVADAAFYMTSSLVPAELSFISGTVWCSIAAFNLPTTRQLMVTLAESILEG